MNSLGAGGATTPRLVNAFNALMFCLMVISCYFSCVIVHYIGIKGGLIFGTYVWALMLSRTSHSLVSRIGYAPFAAGLYTNNRFGTEWLTMFGAALCGICAGVFWMAEAAIAITYPEPWNKGKALGYWLTYRLGGQILGGTINLGINADRDQAGKVSYTVFLTLCFFIFIALQACGPLIALFCNPPSKVQRRDGRKVNLSIAHNPWYEIKATIKLFFGKKFSLDRLVHWSSRLCGSRLLHISCTYVMFLEMFV